MKLAKQKCAHCGKPFRPTSKRQIYHSKECRNSAGQVRLRDRAKRHSEMSAEQNGVMGASNG